MTMDLLILKLHYPEASGLMDQRNSIFKDLLRYQLGEDTARRALHPPRYNIHSKSMTILWHYDPSR